MPELRPGAVTLLRCRSCGAPLSRDAATCGHCGTTDPLAELEGRQVQSSATSAELDFNQARADYQWARAVSRSWQWAVEAYGIPLAVLCFGLLALALASTLGRSNPLLWFLVAAGLPAATAWALFRLSAPSVDERRRAYLILREQTVRCPSCGHQAHAVPSPTGTVRCAYCDASVQTIPVEEFVRAAQRARALAQSASGDRRDAEFQASLRSQGGGFEGLVRFVTVATLLLLAASAYVATRGAFVPSQKRPPKVTPLAYVSDCEECVPLAAPPTEGPLKTGLAVVRTGEGEEGLLVFNGRDFMDCAGQAQRAQTVLLAAPWGALSNASPSEVTAFFTDAYADRARVLPGPGLPLGDGFTTAIEIDGRSQDWTVHVGKCFGWGTLAVAVPRGGSEWFLVLLPFVGAWLGVAWMRWRQWF